jgi:F0F1-type ATP synthase assembly protein I
MKPISQATSAAASPNSGDTKPAPLDRNQARSLFISSSLSMSWQLALAVLIPIVGGYEIDKALHSTPGFTFVGLVIAMGLSALVVSKALKQLTLPKKGAKK